MFSRWMFARLKAAENALNDGRLDEAYKRLSQPELRDLRRARGLLDALSKALVARARLHAATWRIIVATSQVASVWARRRMASDIAARLAALPIRRETATAR